MILELRIGELRTQSLPLFLERRTIAHFRIDNTVWPTAVGQIDHGLAGDNTHVTEQFVGPRDAMWGQQNVFQRAETVRGRDRFLVETIQGRPGDTLFG